MIEVIAFDADDTLWHNESLYENAQEKLRKLLVSYESSEQIDARLFKTEMRNLEYYGYGIKSFILSMIEAAVDISGEQIQGREVREILGYAREMLEAPVELLDHVADVIPPLAESHKLMLITKGDLLDQERKVARSGLGDFFHFVEIVREKSQMTYTTLLDRHKIQPKGFLMVGNSLRSDVLPVLEVGGQAVYIPYHLTWEHETVSGEIMASNPYYELEHIGLLPDLVKRLDERESNVGIV